MTAFFRIFPLFSALMVLFAAISRKKPSFRGIQQGQFGVTMILMIDNYDSFTWNVVQYLWELGA